MKKKVLFIWLMVLSGSGILFAQGVSGVGNQSCAGDGEMWVCGSAQQNQAHIDFDNNCSDYEFEACTVIRTIVDVCSPDMRESRIIEPGDDPSSCPLLN